MDCMLDRILSAAENADNGSELKAISEQLQGISDKLDAILSALPVRNLDIPERHEYPEWFYKKYCMEVNDDCREST